ncbi:hypothetical protein [Moraxella oblonga]|uniref:hypothetical protein n=1 Tax=Moraxella oblonga TaxID=200413 RepID=UPI000836CB5F|nr:hypothetical protein [Moraxella oblonga]
MFKYALAGFLLLPVLGFANSLNDKTFIGKWQCDMKNHEPFVAQKIDLQFLKDGTVNEYFQITYGQRHEYAYQIETANSKAKWRFADDMLIYEDYQLYNYKVRMPNSSKDDIGQASIALNKSLPIIKMMMDNDIRQREFDVSLIDKRSFLANDSQSQMLMTCHKKSWLNFNL